MGEGEEVPRNGEKERETAIKWVCVCVKCESE